MKASNHCSAGAYRVKKGYRRTASQGLQCEGNLARFPEFLDRNAPRNAWQTPVIAALFNPLRRRNQSFIDRRLYRNKYDAAKTLEAFSATLLNETDLDALSDDLVGVVWETMQPEPVTLWLRPDTGSRDRQADK